VPTAKIMATMEIQETTEIQEIPVVLEEEKEKDRKHKQKLADHYLLIEK